MTFWTKLRPYRRNSTLSRRRTMPGEARSRYWGPLGVEQSTPFLLNIDPPILFFFRGKRVGNRKNEK